MENQTERRGRVGSRRIAMAADRRGTSAGAARSTGRLGWFQDHPVWGALTVALVVVLVGALLMVRQLAPGPEGIPMEVHGFTNDIRWSAYEGIQGDLFDHILATIPDFGLRVYQKPSGSDLRQALEAR